ncbi:MAG: SRPBCC domain-containing protein [bacterium]|nr:SRPBCC domain-containing protein [bacterium]
MTDMTDSTDAELIFTLQLEFPKEQVYLAWTEAEQLSQWFKPPGFSVELCEVDAKVGGQFKLHLRSEMGDLYPTQGQYQEVTPNQRLVYIDTWDDDRDQIPLVNVVVFDDLEAGKSRLSLFSVFQSEEHKKAVLEQGEREGWYLFMENLNRHLSNLA